MKSFKFRNNRFIRFEYIVRIEELSAGSSGIIGGRNWPIENQDSIVIVFAGAPPYRLLRSNDYEDFLKAYEAWANNIDTDFEKYERLSIHAAEVAGRINSLLQD
jgi:hypothetical protein